jgi:AmmeMemoRadiSam system protein B
MRPRLRPVEAIPTLQEGKRVIVLRDPDGIAPEPLVLSERTAFLLGFMDGEHTVLDIQAAYVRRFGDLLFTTDIETLLRTLDEAVFLDGERFRAAREETERAYREAKARPAVHLEGADRGTWKRWMEGFFASAGTPEEEPPREAIRGLVVPHIDLRLGGPVYGSGWSAIREGEPPSLVVILGTCHNPIPSLVAATAKDFDTPLGPVPTDRAFLRDLDAAAGGIFEDELVHRREHTVEFQALFVRRLFGARGTKIAPILAAYGPGHLAPEAPPEIRERIARVIRALADLIRNREGRTLVVASADLSHVGPRYGDRSAPSAGARRELEASDRALLTHVAAGDPDALSRRVLETRDRTRVCGYPPIHLLLSILGGAKGSLLRYDQAVMGEDGSIVSFASVALA